LYVWSLTLFEHLRQLCASLIESDMLAGGEVLVIDFDLGNQEAVQGIFVRELLLALAVFLYFLVELLDFLFIHLQKKFYALCTLDELHSYSSKP